jgi:hypothetical protein
MITAVEVEGVSTAGALDVSDVGASEAGGVDFSAGEVWGG